MAVHITRAGVALTVGIIVLTGLIIGGLFWAKNTGEQARREDAIAVAEQNLEEESNEEVVLNDGATSEEEAGPSTEQDAAESAPEATPQTSTVGELPQTGPNDTLSIILLGVSVFLAVSYVQSRRSQTEAV